MKRATLPAAAVMWCLGLSTLVATAGAAHAAPVTVLKGSVLLKTNDKGVDVRANGPLELRLNASAGTFSCVCSTTASMLGTTRMDGDRVHVRSNSKAATKQCSGTWRGGALSGNMRFSHRGKAVFTELSGPGAKPAGGGEAIAITADFTAKISGTVSADKGGSGTITDDDGLVWRWSVQGAEPPSGDESGAKDTARKPKGDPSIGAGLGVKPAKDKPARLQALKFDKRLTESFGLGGAKAPQAKEAPKEDVKADPPADRPEPKTREGLLDELKKSGGDASRKKAMLTKFLELTRARTDEKVKALDKQMRETVAGRAFVDEVHRDAAKLADGAQRRPDRERKQAIERLQKKGWGWVDRGGGRKSGGTGSPKLPKLASAGDAMARATALADKAAAKTADKGSTGVELLDEIKQVRETVTRINDKVKSGEISKDRGKLLKGGTYLGKALSKIVSWLPVFGSTASKVTDQSFGAAMKAGETVAAHYTLTDCCIEDALGGCCK